MINWYKLYDEESDSASFNHTDYSKYNPYSNHCIFAAPYFSEIKQNYASFDTSNSTSASASVSVSELPLSSDYLCRHCQQQQLRQSVSLRGAFTTESLLSQVPELRQLAAKACHFFEAERFYYYSFWNAVTNNKQFLLDRLSSSYTRFYKFLLDLHCALVSNAGHLDASGFCELQQYLTKMYSALALEIEHFDYIYPQLVGTVQLIRETASKLLEPVPFPLLPTDIHSEKEVEVDVCVSPVQRATEVDEEKTTEKMQRSLKAVDEAIDMGTVKKNLRKTFHERKALRFQSQKQVVDRQLLNKGQREINSLRKYFIDNMDRQSSSLYCYSDILSECYLTDDIEENAKADCIGKDVKTDDLEKCPSILESKEFKESPNNPNYQSERAARIMEKKKLRELDEYILSVSNEYMESIKDALIYFQDPQNEGSLAREKRSPSLDASREPIDFTKLVLSGNSGKKHSPTRNVSLIDKARPAGEEVSDESVFTDEEVAQERENGKSMNFVGMAMLKMAGAVGEKGEREESFWLGEGKEQKKRKESEPQVKLEDWVSHLSFNELIRQKKFDVIPKKAGVRINIDKKPGKYRDARAANSKEENWAI